MPEQQHYDGPEYRTGIEMRAGDDDTTTLTIARFGVWNEVVDYVDGRMMRFLEQPMPGAYTDSFAARGAGIKVLFNHGRDVLGQKALGTPVNLRESDVGPQADIRWIDRPYVDDIRAGIPPSVERSIYGVSYMFRAQEEDWDMNPERAEHNPGRIPERKLYTVDTRELGLVTFAADQGTEELVGVRSLTERFAPQTSRESKKSEHQPSARRADLDTKRAETATAFRFNQRRRSA